MIVYTDKHRVPFIIDDEDWDAVSRYTWHISSDGYPRTNIRRDGKYRPVKLHLLLLGPASDGLEWDHKNQDRLDNRRENLRPATHSVNQRNASLHHDNLSGVRGVSWDVTRQRWRVQIYTRGKQHSLGYYQTVEDATTARLLAERELWQSET